MINEEKLSNSLKEFKMKYPNVNSSDLQAFIMGWQKAELENNLTYKYENKGKVKSIFPAHNMIKYWKFTEDTKEEALFANQMAVIAEKNGMTANDLQHIFPAVLRMLKSNTTWAGYTNCNHTK